MRRCSAEGILIWLLTPAHSARSKSAAELQCLSSCCVKAAIEGQTRAKSLQGAFHVSLNSELTPSLKHVPFGTVLPSGGLVGVCFEAGYKTLFSTVCWSCFLSPHHHISAHIRGVWVSPIKQIGSSSWPFKWSGCLNNIFLKAQSWWLL